MSQSSAYSKRKYNNSENGKTRRKEWLVEYSTTDRYKEVASKASKRFHRKNRTLLQDEKMKQGCIDCGYKANPVVLDFDHITGEKNFCPSKSVSRTKDTTSVEISKCVVRCSNCHRIKTAIERQNSLDKQRISNKTIDAPVSKNREAYRRLHKKRRDYIQAEKLKRGCIDCGFSAHPAALDFDHVQPESKSFTVSQSMGRSEASLAAEIAKCVVRCSNCHRLKTLDSKSTI